MAHAVLTGPIKGVVTLPSGVEIDVTPAVIEVEDDLTAKAVADAIGKSYAINGHPTDPNFTYVPPEEG